MSGQEAGESDEDIDALAKLEFEACAIPDGAHDTYVNQWTGVAIALTLLSKTPEECREAAARLEEQEGDWETMVETLASTRAWLKDTDKLVEMAMGRLCCGLARHAQHAD